MAAPAWGYSNDESPESTLNRNYISTVVAAANFSAQLEHSLRLARDNPNKQVVSHLAAVGLGVFKNDPKSVGVGLRLALQQFQVKLQRENAARQGRSEKPLNIQVRYEIFRYDPKQPALSEGNPAFEAAVSAGLVAA